MSTLCRLTLSLFLLLVCLSSASLHAQQPVVFVHGLNSNGGTWDEAAQRVQQDLDVRALQPTQSWWETYQQQAVQVESNPGLIGLPPWAIAFGHSNGGIVSREWSKLHPLYGLATIGTPHQGAPLVSHIDDWVNFAGSALWYDSGIVGSFSSGHNSHLQWILNALLGSPMAWSRWFTTYVTYQSLAVAGLNFAVPVLGQMVPGSPYLSELNGSPNVSRESSIPYRIGIVDIPPNFWFGGPIRLMVPPEHADDAAWGLHAAAIALFYYGSYVLGNVDTSDPFGLSDANDKANWMMLLGEWLNEIDLTWCSLVSSPGPVQGAACRPNDSLVSFDSQLYPGAINVLYEGAAHTFETRYSDSAIEYVLHNMMGVPLKWEPPPPPPEPPPDPPAGGDILGPFQTLYHDQSIRSANGRFILYYQTDGNLVLLRDEQAAIWASNTGYTGEGTVTMQGDGNLVLLDPGGVCRWSSNTWGNDGAFLLLQDDGNLVIYRPDGTPIWATGTNE